ncbi:MAG: ABC transporter permease [Pseudomonadota bacterium]
MKIKNRLLYLSSWRYYLKHPLHLLFSILGVALGVALVVGIDLASHSAREAFNLSSQSITGKATHRIVSSKNLLAESLYIKLRNKLGLRKVAPLIKQSIQVQITNNTPQLRAQLIGIDPFSEAEIRNWQQQALMPSLPANNLNALLTKKNSILVEHSFLAQYNLQVGDKISLIVEKNGSQQDLPLFIIGSYKAPEVYRSQLKNWLISDISTAQELLNLKGYISQIDLLIAPSQVSTINKIKQLLPETIQLVEADKYTKATAQLSQSFELNLTALSLLGLLVAMFLIYNTMMFSIVQRRDLLARMRVLGVCRKELFQLVLLEAFFIAILSTLIGIASGFALAQILLYFVSRTINDLYYVSQVTEVYWSYISLLKALSLGIGATLLSALIPALEAAYTRPVMALQRSELETKINLWSRWLLLPGGFGCLLVYWLLKIPFSDHSNAILMGFSSIFLLLAAFICLLPFISRYLLMLLAILMKFLFNLPGKMAVNNISRSFSRSIVAIAALTISVSSALGIGIMVDSFRFTVDDWLLAYLKADYYISSFNNSSVSRPNNLLDPLDKSFVSALSQMPGVNSISSNQEVRFFIDGKYHNLTVLDIPANSFSAFHFKQGNAATAQQAWFEQDAIIISEPYAYHHGISMGDNIYLPIKITAQGEYKQAFKVVGIYYHYGSEQGLINMSRATYKRHWKQQKLNAMGLYLSSEILQNKHKKLQFEQQLEALIKNKSLQYISKQQLRNSSMIIFDRTFKITNVLKLLVVLVSFVGIITALMAIELERSREFAILRATGLTGRQLSTMVYIETLTMGIVAAILAIPIGIVLAYLLIDVINYRSFGWSMQFILPWKEFVLAVGLAIFASFLAAIYPAWSLSKTSPALALRGD